MSPEVAKATVGYMRASPAIYDNEANRRVALDLYLGRILGSGMVNICRGCRDYTLLCKLYILSTNPHFVQGATGQTITIIKALITKLTALVKRGRSLNY